MNATTKNEANSEAARRAVIESLSRSELKTGAGPKVKELDEACARRPKISPVRLMIYI